jgi:hypothetical protein
VRSAPPPAQDAHDASLHEHDAPEAAPRPHQPEPARREPAHFSESERQGDWTWRDLLSSVDDPNAAAPRARVSRRRDAEDPVAHLRRQISEPRTSTLPIVETIQQAGLRLDEVFSPSGLERIAQRARSGTQARRKAVREAAPDASRKLADHLARDPHANQEAMLFLRNEGARIVELISRGRASMNAEATRAFLLIDAAAG